MGTKGERLWFEMMYLGVIQAKGRVVVVNLNYLEARINWEVSLSACLWEVILNGLMKEASVAPSEWRPCPDRNPGLFKGRGVSHVQVCTIL